MHRDLKLRIEVQMTAALHLQDSASPYKTEGPRQKSLLTIE